MLRQYLLRHMEESRCFVRNGLQMGSKSTSHGRENNPADYSEVVLNDQGGGRCMNISHSVVETLRAETHGHAPIVLQRCFGIGAYNSAGWLSDNPHAGIYEAETSRCLSTNGCNPSCNQGGIVVLATFEGNGTRPSHLGTGFETKGKVMYTLNSTEVHGVIYELPKQDGSADGQ